ncbi:MAG: glycosyltransferase family 39 protein [Polyangiaceae bacterium]
MNDSREPTPARLAPEAPAERAVVAFLRLLTARSAASTRDVHGLPVASAVELRWSRVAVGVATVWFLLAAAWECAGPLLAGHYASTASVGIIADNMLHWRIPGPVWEYTAARPPPSAYYCHHPWGIFWTQALFTWLLGRSDLVCRLPPILLSVATPPLLYAIGRTVWRPAAGALAALSYVSLPITLAFAHFNALEVPVTAWALLALWGYVRFTQTWRTRWMVVSLLGIVLSIHADWPAYVLYATLLGAGFARRFVIPGAHLGRVEGIAARRRAARRYLAWWLLTAGACTLSVALYLWLFSASGKLEDLLGSAEMRSAGNRSSLATVLAARRYWNQLMFTPLVIALGKACAVLAVVRVLWLRREHELLPLCWLAMAAFQYVVFKQGADIHVFWPHYFAAYVALAMGALVATAIPLGELVAERIEARRAAVAARGGGGRVRRYGAGVAALLCAAPLALVLRDGIPALRYARETGGRFNEKGLLIDSDGDKTRFLAWVNGQLPAQVIVDLHESMRATWAQVWAMGGRLVSPDRALPRGQPRDGRTAYLADTRFLGDDAQQALLAQGAVVAVGPFWFVDRAARGGPLTAWRFVERPPSPLEWYFLSGTEPQRDIVADPYGTWELRTHFAQAAEAPGVAPATLSERRIAHNAALAAGDAPRAAALLAEIEAELRPLAHRFASGPEVVGTRWEPGAADVLTLVLRAPGPMRAGQELGVSSRVVARAPFSTTMADPVVREVGMPLAISPRRWRPGFLYEDRVVVRRRPGSEVFSAWWADRGARGRRQEVEVLRLP